MDEHHGGPGLLVQVGARMHHETHILGRVLFAADKGSRQRVASRGADTIIRYLVEQGARLDAEDARGRTPLDIAEGHVLYISVYIRESSARLLRELFREHRVEHR